jgi:HAD superfamily phosphoserine phosphatase-like hydrolase
MLLTDFDGTLTQHDFFEMAVEHLVPPGGPDYWSQYLSGEITHFDALKNIFNRIRATDDQIMQIARRCELEPLLGDCVARLNGAGWQVEIVSAGCSWYIARLLAERGIELQVHSNPGDNDPHQGLVMNRYPHPRYHDHQRGVSKEAIVRDALDRYQDVAFAGDGRPDIDAARLVADHRRFARRMLAECLDAEGLPYRNFDRWSDIAEILVQETG